MKVLFLFSRPRIFQAADLAAGKGHDNHFIGMYRIRKYGIETDFLDPEHILPAPVAYVWRRIFNIWWMHVPFFPLFFRHDMVFAGGAYGSLLLKAVVRLRRHRWVIYDANISGTIGDCRTLRQKVFRFAVSRTDGIVTLSQVEEDTLRAMFPQMNERVQFLYEGVDTSYFTPSTSPEGDYILSVGLDPGRDFSTLIEAMRELPEVSLKIATKPERVASCGPLPPNVTAQLYSHEEMRDLYARARFVVIGLNMKTDNNDSMGTYAVIEAMASGKPVIVTATKALVSYIEHNSTGMFVPVRDVDAMRDAIRDLWDNKEKRSAIGTRARAFAVEHCDAELYAKRLAEFFKKIHALR
jgi:glycosyltransferase involved in cell wall biosynthesis